MGLSEATHGDEYYDTIDKLSEVLLRHVKPSNPHRPKNDAHHFIAAYRAFLDDFWDRETASNAIDDFVRALHALCETYVAIPPLVRGEIEARARGMDYERREEFLRTTTADIVFKSSLPSLDGSAAADALKVLVRHKGALISAIAVERKELPEGMKTRNRPGTAYAVIHAAAEVVRTRMNVPKAVAEAGPFYRLLVDLFELCEVEVSVPGAFRGWRKHIDGKYENMDLMPIE